MKAWLLTAWDGVRASYWFVPAVMVIASVLVALLSFWIDDNYAATVRDWPLVYGAKSDMAMDLLSTLAGSMITTVSFVFSVLIVSLTLAAGQYGPRLLRTFMQDRGNQIVLGTFVATFIYCLLVLSRIRSGDDRLTTSITLAMTMTIVSFGLLVYFIHHAASMLQADNIIASVSAQLHLAIADMHRRQNDEPSRDGAGSDDSLPDDLETNSKPVPSEKDGYISMIDFEEIIKAARQSNALVKLLQRSGDFVVRGDTLALVHPAKAASDGTIKRVRDAVALAHHRTPVQDVEFAVHELVEVALRALSPSINDPFTATTCVDFLSAGVCKFLDAGPPDAFRRDESGRLLVIADATDFEGLVDAAFSQIRQNLSFHVSLGIRMLEAMLSIVPHCRGPQQRLYLLHHGQMIHRAMMEKVAEPADRKDLDERLTRLTDACGQAQRP